MDYLNENTNALWIKTEIDRLLRAANYYDSFLSENGYYEKYFPNMVARPGESKLESAIRFDLMTYSYWVAWWSDDFSEDKNRFITKYLDFVPTDFDEAERIVEDLKKDHFLDRTTVYKPEALRCFAFVEHLLAVNNEAESKEESYVQCRAYFRIMNMIADTLGYYGGEKKNRTIIIGQFIDWLSNDFESAYGYSPNEKRYEEFYPDKHDEGIVGFKPLCLPVVEKQSVLSDEVTSDSIIGDVEKDSQSISSNDNVMEYEKSSENYRKEEKKRGKGKLIVLIAVIIIAIGMIMFHVPEIILAYTVGQNYNLMFTDLYVSAGTNVCECDLRKNAYNDDNVFVRRQDNKDYYFIYLPKKIRNRDNNVVLTIQATYLNNISKPDLYRNGITVDKASDCYSIRTDRTSLFSDPFIRKTVSLQYGGEEINYAELYEFKVALGGRVDYACIMFVDDKEFIDMMNGLEIEDDLYEAMDYILNELE